VTALTNRELPGSTRVIEGVYKLEDIEDIDEEALRATDPGLIIRRFRGYSSWFPV
jgi:hypothetical protein